MSIVKRLGNIAALGAATLVWSGAAATTASADVIYQTEGPFGGIFGLIGFDVSSEQSVGLRITPDAVYTLDGIGLWFMNNDSSGERGFVTVTLRDDALSETGGSIPGDTIYESWTFQISAVGWDPQLERMESVLHPLLDAGTNYWIVAESETEPLINPVWNWAAHGTNFTATTNFMTGEWQDGGEGAAVTAIVVATPTGGEPDFDLELSDPMIGGEDATFTVSNAIPSENIYLAYSLAGEGNTFVPRLGVTLGLQSPRQAGGAVPADEFGGARWTLPVPRQASGRTVWFQAAQQGAVSDVESAVVQ